MFNSISLIKILSGLSKTISVARELIPIFGGIKPIIDKGIDIVNNANIKSNGVNNVQRKNAIVTKKGPTFFQ